MPLLPGRRAKTKLKKRSAKPMLNFQIPPSQEPVLSYMKDEQGSALYQQPMKRFGGASLNTLHHPHQFLCLHPPRIVKNMIFTWKIENPHDFDEKIRVVLPGGEIRWIW